MNEIIVLPPEERVRRKPNVVFPSGSKQVFTDMFKILLAEACHGYCTRIDIMLYKDGTIDLVTNGRGFRVGAGDQWKDLFLVLPVKGVYTFLLDETVFSLYEENTDCLTKEERRFYDDLSLPSIQYVCERMDCIIYRDGRMYELHFRKGIPTNAVPSICGKQQKGMHISFMIDPEVFNKQHILPPDYVIDIARTAATRMTGLTVSVKVEEDDDWCVHVFGGKLEQRFAKEES